MFSEILWEDFVHIFSFAWRPILDYLLLFKHSFKASNPLSSKWRLIIFHFIVAHFLHTFWHNLPFPPLFGTGPEKCFSLKFSSFLAASKYMSLLPCSFYIESFWYPASNPEKSPNPLFPRVCWRLISIVIIIIANFPPST